MSSTSREELEQERQRMDAQIAHLRRSDTALSKAMDASYRELRTHVDVLEKKMDRVEAKMDRVILILEGRH